MKIEIVCPCCGESFQVITPDGDIRDENNLYDDDQPIFEQELLEKHNILLG